MDRDTEMTDKEIMEKAMAIAFKNGHNDPVPWNHIGDNISDFHIRGVFMNHSFAKAFWGEELLFCGKPISEFPKDPDNQVFKTSYLSIKAWRYHLQQMVLEENPIQYLKQYL